MVAKPEKAERLEVDGDFSWSMLQNAHDRITEFLSQYTDNKRTIYYTIGIPSQTMGIAAIIGHAMNIPIEIQFDYKVDEWSLSGKVYDTKQNQMVESMIWSPGA